MPIVTWATRKGLSFKIENYVVLKLIEIKVCIPNLVDFEKFQTLPPQKKIVTTF
jgi:hypothetical protein